MPGHETATAAESCRGDPRPDLCVVEQCGQQAGAAQPRDDGERRGHDEGDVAPHRDPRYPGVADRAEAAAVDRFRAAQCPATRTR